MYYLPSPEWSTEIKIQQNFRVDVLYQDLELHWCHHQHGLHLAIVLLSSFFVGALRASFGSTKSWLGGYFLTFYGCSCRWSVFLLATPASSLSFFLPFNKRKDWARQLEDPRWATSSTATAWFHSCYPAFFAPSTRPKNQNSYSLTGWVLPQPPYGSGLPTRSAAFTAWGSSPLAK